MFHFQSDLIHSDSRIVAVSKWRNPCRDYHLRYIYYATEAGYDKGFRNFFNESLDVMTVAQAQKHLNWEMPKRVKKRKRYATRKHSLNHSFDELPASLNKYLTLCVYPSSDFYYCSGKSQNERELAFLNAVRQSMIQLIAETELPLNWVAAVNASSIYMRAMIVVSKKIFDSEKREFTILDKKHKCFPPSFFSREKPTAENTNHIEETIAKAFFDCAAQTEDFENRIDKLIEISRKYKFELPLNYYAFRYLDDKGNLITEREKMLLSSNKRYEQFTLERKSPAKS